MGINVRNIKVPKKGKPNLIKCEACHQISVILSLYANSYKEPAPSNDELLFCTSRTTGEEVENYLRLVVTSPLDETRIYCIANIQELGYEAQSSIEKFLHSEERFSKAPFERFALVFVTTTAKPSLIASVLEKYRVDPVMFDDGMLGVYLRDKLKEGKASAVLDPEGYNVRVLVSKRSGNGKSKYVKYLLKRNPSVDYKVIRVKSSVVDVDAEIKKFIDHRLNSVPRFETRLYHLDIAYEVRFNRPLDSQDPV